MRALETKRSKYMYLMDDIAKEYAKGEKTRKELAEEFKVSESTIGRYLGILDVKKPRKCKNGEMKIRKTKILVNPEYFDEITNENARDLAFIFGVGNISKSGKGIVLSLYTKKHLLKDMLDVVNKFANKGEDDVYTPAKEPDNCRIRVSSIHLCNRLKELGIKREFPEFECSESEWNFYDSYFKHFAIFRPFGLRISLRYNNDKTNLVKYLKSIGVEGDLKVIKGGIVLTDENYIENIFKKHPVLINEMIKHCTEKEWSPKWSRIINRFRNNV